MSTLAIDGSQPSDGGSRGATVVRYADLGLLALALPAFLVAGWPMLGYAVAAAAWLAQRGIQLAAERRARTAMAAGNRRNAMGFIAGSTLARVWLVALAILLVGGLADREDGLAAAILAACLVTLSFIGLALARLFGPEEER